MPIIDDLRFYRGLEQNLPPLAQGQPAVTLDTNKLFVGTPNGNIEFAQQSAVSVLQKTPQEYEWTTTAGQVVYVLPSGTTYDTLSKWLTFTVGGATIEDSLIKKDSPTQFTLLVDPSLIPGGVKAVARWVMPYIPASDTLSSQISTNITNIATNTANIATNTTNIASNTASLADMTNKVYGGEPNGTDDTTHLQAVINSLLGNNGTLILKSGKTYNVTTLTVTGKLKIDGNWATLNSISPDNTAPMIQNNSGVKLTVKEVAFNGKNVAIQNTLIGNASGVGTRTYVDNCSFQGLTRVSNGIMLRQNDFVKISNCIFYNYDTSIRIESDYSVNERDNTQIFFDNINFGWCNLAVYMRQCDKAELKGCDIQICGSGFYLAQDNKRVRFVDCHVEHWGNSTYTGSINFGYAYYIPPALTQNDITYENCTAFLGDSGALAGFYKGYNDVAWTDATYRNCYADVNASLTNYRSFNVAGTYKIEGRWDYLDNQVSIYSANSRFNDSIIKPYGNVNSASENLLPFSRISSPEQFSTSGTGTLTISADTDGNLYNAKNIAITTSSQYENYVLLTLKRGWYTLLFNGYSVTGTPYMYVEQHASPFSEKVRAQMKAGRPNQIYRMVFFVPTTESYRVGFWANTNASFILNRWELHFGFDYEYSDDPSLYKMANQPTQGYWLKGERVRNNNITELGSVGSKYVIQEWECITVGSPGVWLQKRFLTGN